MRRKLLNPKILLPVLLSAALIVFVLGIGDLSVVGERLAELTFGTIAAAFALAPVYLAVKLVQYRRFLARLGIHPRWSQMVLAFAIGEMSLSLPAGAYVQGFVLKHIHGAEVSRSAAAATFAIGFEAAIALITLAAVGIPGWAWLRPTLGLFFLVMGVLLALILGVRKVQQAASYLLQVDGLKRPGGWIILVAVALRQLITPRVLLPGLLLAAAYLFCVVGGFWVLGQGVGLTSFSFVQAMTVYFFGLSVVLLLGPFSTQLGVIEASGLGAMIAWGYGRNEALAALLAFRIVWTGSIWLICLPVVVLLRREFEGRYRRALG